MKPNSNRMLFAGFILALALLGGVAWLNWRHTSQMQEAAELVSQTHEVQANLNRLLTLMDDIETGQRGFLITGDPKFLDSFESGLKVVGEQQQHLGQLILDPELKTKLAALEPLIVDRIAFAQANVQVRRNSGFEAAQKMLLSGKGKALMDAIRARLAEMDAREQMVLDARSAAARREADTTRLLTLAGDALGAALLIAVFMLVLRENRLRQKANLALQASEENLSVTLHSIGDAVLTTDTEGRVTQMNTIAEKLTGWMRAEALGRPIAEVFNIINEDTRQPAVIPVEKVLATGTIQGLVNHTVVIARDGKEYPIANSAAPIRDKNGQVLGVILVVRDVTEGHRAERAVRESEVQYRTLFDSIDEGYCIIEVIFDAQEKPVDYRFLQVNPAFEKQSGLRDALGKRMREFAPQHEEHWFETFGRIAMTGEPARFQNYAEALQRWFDVYAFRFGEPKNRQVGIIFSDITNRKQMEEKIRVFNEDLQTLVAQRTAEVREALATLDATADGAYIFEPASLRFTYVNKGAVRQLGYTREELLAMSPLDSNTNQDETTFREMIAPLKRGEKSVLTYENVYHRKDGGKFPVEINLQYITQAGSPPHFVAIVRDITERKKAEQQAMRSQRMDSIGTLAGGVAHDLNNALAPIMMSVGMLRQQYPKESKILEMIEISTKRGADMVRQLLTFAKGAEGKRVVLQPIRIVNELEKMMKGSFPKNIEIAVKCDPNLPTVLGDTTQLHQVLLNLCVNARDAMPHGGRLTVAAQSILMDEAYASSIPEAKPGRYVLLRVQDTGTGIPPEIMERIFEPFFTTKNPDQGTGLGLSSVMGIVKGHDGLLQVYSQPGQGSTFNVYLPADHAGGSDMEQPTKTPVEFRGQGETILVVDDEPAFLETARMLLSRMNFKVVTANDGEDGLMKVAEFHTELRVIITDLHMPHMDGLAFTRAVRRKLPDLPVAVASGRVDDISAKEFKNLGRVSILDKPFTEAELVEMLKTFLRK